METPATDRTTATSVYLYYDAAGILIYVGITRTGVTRNRQHNSDKEWWPFVSAQKIEHHESTAAAHRREIGLIQKHRPPFNKQHNPDHKPMRAAYLAAQAGDAFWSEKLIGVSSREKSVSLELVSADWKRGEVELRSHAFTLVSLGNLTLNDKRPVINETNYQIGCVYAVEHDGAVTTVKARIKAPWRISAADVYVKRRGQFASIKKVVATGVSRAAEHAAGVN